MFLVRLLAAAQSVKVSFLARKLGHKFLCVIQYFCRIDRSPGGVAVGHRFPDVFIANVQCIFVLFVFRLTVLLFMCYISKLCRF